MVEEARGEVALTDIRQRRLNGGDEGVDARFHGKIRRRFQRVALPRLVADEIQRLGPVGPAPVV